MAHLDHIFFTFRVDQFAFEQHTHGVEDSLGGDPLVAEKAKPFQLVDNRAFSTNHVSNGLLGRFVGLEKLLGELTEVKIAQFRVLFKRCKIVFSQEFHNITPTFVAEGAADDRFALRDVVDILVFDRVAVGVPFVIDAVDGLHSVGGLGKQINTIDGDLLPFFLEQTAIAGSKENTTRTPAQFVPKRVVVEFRGRKTAADAVEFNNFTTFLVNFVDDLLSAHVIQTRIDTAFVEQNNASSFRFIIQGLHLVADVASGAEVFFVFDGDTSCLAVVDVREHGDDEIMSLNERFEFFHGTLSFHIKLNRGDVLKVFANSLGSGQGPRSDRGFDLVLVEELDHRGRAKAAAQDKNRFAVCHVVQVPQ
mmetsp:Transcript_35302/g.69245  ORF Transcript_35302/g.69245 Transcript_35302/m.69245 type:complete len:363 (-) Transcript_35302:19-1107(-)